MSIAQEEQAPYRCVGVDYSSLKPESRDERTLIDQHRSNRNQCFLGYLDRVLKIRSMCLKSEDSSNLINLIIYDPRSSTPPYVWSNSKLLVKLWTFSSGPLGAFITQFLLFCLSIELIVNAIVNFEYFRLLKLYNDIHDKASSIGSLSEEQIPSKLLQTSKWLEMVAAPLITKPGLGSLIMGVAGIGSLASYHIMIVFLRNSKRRILCDELGFLFNPVAHRRAIVAQLKENAYSTNALLPEEQLELGASLAKQLDETQRLQVQKSADSFRGAIKAIVADLSSREGSLEWPAIVSAKWHKRCSENLYPILYIIQNYPIYWVIVTFNLMFLAEVSHKLNGRLERASLNITTSDAYFHVDPLRLEPLVSREHAVALSNYKGNFLDYVSLLVTEASYYYTFRRLMIISKILILATLAAHFFMTDMIILVLCAINKITWINQLIEQINSSYTESTIEPKLALAASSMKAYLNFELFRKQFPPHNQLESLIVFQIIAYTIPTLFISYMIAITLNVSARGSILYCTFTQLVSSNVGIIVSCYKTRLIMKMMHSVSHHLARLSRSLEDNPYDYSVAIALDCWRKQIIDEKQLEDFHASKMLGFSITYSQFMRANAYYIATWLIMLRVASE